MNRKIKLKDEYVLANCCQPEVDFEITGYYSHNNVIKVHRSSCQLLAKADADRLIQLQWPDIVEKAEFAPGSDYNDLTTDDFSALRHHLEYGIDYSLMLAKVLNISKQAAFDCHKKLQGLGLLKRVEPTMVRYRKGVVDNKWIKHRNHTYYDLTSKGRSYINFFNKSKN